MADFASPSTPVEARSLSSITSIAANPPAYPRNPAHPRLDRIELYIVRVPGSKDVVLTPLKPPTKSNISIEAINSSLYYLHAATEEDEDLLRSIEAEQAKQIQDAPAQDGPSALGLPSEAVSRLNSFHRKPVGRQDDSCPVPPPPPPPPPPPLHRDGLPNLALQRPSHDSRFPTQPTGDERSLDSNNRAAHDSTSPINRKSVPSQFTIPRRPVSSSGSLTTNTPAFNATIPDTSATSQRLSYDGARPSKESSQTQQHPSPDKPSFSSNSNDTKSSQAAAPFRVTVIRRDTASGNQWNVATISSSSADNGVIHIEISNPAYGKFIDNAPLPPTATTGQSAAEVLKMAQNVLHDDNVGKRGFYRDVVPVRHDRDRSLSEALFHRRSGSGVDASKIVDIVSAKINRGYYSFQSPWNGTCSFVASINGGSVKCKHAIPGPSMSAELDGREHNDEVTVAELRYNIPFPLEQTSRLSMMNFDGSSSSSGGSNLSPRGKEKGTRAALSQLITSNIEKVQQRARAHSQSGLWPPTSRGSSEDRSPSSTAAFDEDRLDLSLAREHGGGGMSGKSAKLGKLIIEDEGIKMIDLVVAASMGVWWRSTYQMPVKN